MARGIISVVINSGWTSNKRLGCEKLVLWYVEICRTMLLTISVQVHSVLYGVDHVVLAVGEASPAPVVAFKQAC